MMRQEEREKARDISYKIHIFPKMIGMKYFSQAFVPELREMMMVVTSTML